MLYDQIISLNQGWKFSKILHLGDFFLHLDSLHYSHYYISEVCGDISVFILCALNWNVTCFASAWICTRKVRELSWFSGRVYRSKSLYLLPAILPKSWASIPGSPVHCSNRLSTLAMKELSINWMAKMVFQAFFLNEQNPNVTLVVVFIWLFGGSVAWTERTVAVRPLTHSCPALGASSGTCCPALPSGIRGDLTSRPPVFPKFNSWPCSGVNSYFHQLGPARSTLSVQGERKYGKTIKF